MTSEILTPFKTNQMILEGPDLVGKTTLYREIHQRTGFKWNIQDRSSLSMLCYARQFGRSTKVERERLLQELNNLNNRMIILLPPFEVVIDRYNSRGDEVQDVDSLRTLYDIFSQETSLIRGRPNVMCLASGADLGSIVMSVEEWSYSIESCNLRSLGDVVRDTLHGTLEDELTLTARVQYPLGDPDESILSNALEGEYYNSVLCSVEQMIQNELDGLNPYDRPQGLDSRRFYYNSDTCISGIHFMPRLGKLRVMVTFRSLDVDRNAVIDLTFIEFLTHRINQKFNFDCREADVWITFNSAHIRRDLAGDMIR